MSLTYLEIIKRLLLALILSGVIGFEREITNKPAGFRTHILVCIGSTIIMLISIKMHEIYRYESDIDPTRLGAQVISGIGFLGAGTIIREGATVKGLTTAATLWVVSCIGLAVGAGFYIISLVASICILITLLVFIKIENYYILRKNLQYLSIMAKNQSGQLGKIGDALGSINILIKNIEMDVPNDEKIIFYFTLQVPSCIKKEDIIKELSEIPGILSVKTLY
ncbi:MgtC/SapB family protein [Garciella nitratireducens]|uniref:Putative Mg2+ transporter-C (MgtC) family protein n=1 Tax=Garciella nitratireducens DSM 15102 TaxID=1121911 RepID=A0A1T4JWY3_9FIRM|nr:MgtC/SapB family protein [Garciella nitratireducens]SJZ34607.1 putative Mg2+ transporter-C (MgtC) family protein [Garciella nitratireducens DSM 15102]